MKKLIETTDTVRLENVVKFEVGKVYVLNSNDFLGKPREDFYKVIKRTKKTIFFMALIFKDYEDNPIIKCKCEYIEIRSCKYVSSNCIVDLPYPTESVVVDEWDMASTYAHNVVDENEALRKIAF